MENIQSTQGSAFQTPIEIALGVDENGMTTARKLYAFLGLSKGQFSRWAKSNIADNQFATENEDYWGFDIYVEGNLAQDYKLTAHFAKKLSVKGNGARAEEAREYFTRLEEKNKQQAIDRTQLSPQLQLMNMLVENMSRQELEQKRQAEQIQRLEDNQKNLVETFQSSPDSENFQSWANKCLSRIAESPNFNKGVGRNSNHALARTESYERLKKKKNCNLDDRLARAKGRAMDHNPGITKTELNSINKLTIITNDKSLRPIYETVIKEMMIAYCVETN